MQKKHETPEIEIIELEDLDVIVSSFENGAGDSGFDQGSGSGW